MGLIDKIRGTVGGKAEELTAKIAQSYRDHLGEELLKKQQELKTLEAELKSRDEDISKREANLKKYYLVPRAYITIPIGLVLLAVIYFGYQALKPEVNTESPQTSISSPHFIAAFHPHSIRISSAFHPHFIRISYLDSKPLAPEI